MTDAKKRDELEIYTCPLTSYVVALDGEYVIGFREGDTFKQDKPVARSGVYMSSDKYSAMLDFIMSEAKTIEADFSYSVTNATFLKDTTQTSQWRKTKNYYGQSLGGTDFPARWYFERLGAGT